MAAAVDNDPWSWDTDRLVKELCTNDTSWEPISPVMPNPAELEAFLRQNRYTGGIFIHNFEYILRISHWGKSLDASRFNLIHCVDQLRERSTKWRHWNLKRRRLATPSALEEEFQAASDVPRSPSPSHVSDPAPVQSPQNHEEPLTPGDRPLSITEQTLESIEPDEVGRPPNLRNGESWVVDESGRKRRRLALTSLTTIVPAKATTEVLAPVEAALDDIPPLGSVPNSFFSKPAFMSEKAVSTGEPATLQDISTTSRVDELDAASEFPTTVLPEDANAAKEPFAADPLPNDSNTARDVTNTSPAAETGITEDFDPSAESAASKEVSALVPATEARVDEPKSPEISHSPVGHAPPEPGRPFRDAAGKKRILPCLLNIEPTAAAEHALDNGGAEGLAAAQQLLDEVNRAKEQQLCKSMGDGYLGPQKMPIDSLFYGKTAFGEHLPDTTEVNFFHTHQYDISSGRRRYVSKAMRRYFRAPRRQFTRAGRVFTAIQPYPVGLIPPIQTPAFTLYESTKDGVRASKQNLLEWPEASTEHQQSEDPLLNLRQDAATTDTNQNHYAAALNPSTLQKYLHIEGGDEVLPLYGDSDSDEEYDNETWREIEKELGPQKTPRVRKTRPPLSEDEVHKVINERIAVVRQKWHDKEKPKKQAKAGTLWKMYQRSTQQDQMLKLQQDMLQQVQTQRIPKIRAEIIRAELTSRAKVYSLAAAIDQSIHLQEFCTWRLGIMQSTTPPEKVELVKKAPAATTQPRQRKTVVQESEVEDTDSASDDSLEDSGDDSDDDFIVDDEPNPKLPESSRPPVSSQPGPTKPRRLSLVLRRSQTPKTQMSSQQDSLYSLFHGSMPSQGATSSQHSNRQPVDSDGDESEPIVHLVKPRRRKSSSADDSDEYVDHDTVQLPKDRPPLHNPDAIAKYGYVVWHRLEDRDRLIIAMIHNLQPTEKEILLDVFKTTSEEDMWERMISTLYTLCGMDGESEGSLVSTYKDIIRAFDSWIDCQYHRSRRVIRRKAALQLYDKFRDYGFQFEPFHARIRQLQKLYADHEDLFPEPLTNGRRRPSTGSGTGSNEPKQASQRKRRIWEDRDAREFREQDRKRQAEQEKRRQILRRKLEASGSLANRSSGSIIINEGKFEDEGFVYIEESIGQRIKNHQIEGVRFLWSQLVTKGRKQQGCLLAHTMGLGKTMQVITFLVAIAQAAASDDPSISSQIPGELRESRTLVLAPVSLLDNWLDELLMWTPEGALGSFRKVSSQGMDMGQRCDTVDNWHREGGILLIGYEVFRSMVLNKSTKTRQAPLSSRMHKKVEKQLLEGPNLVVADEAHKMKNTKSNISEVARRFKSQSRIALTGSPLANNVEEYHTMISWVAPGYLGPVNEFRAKYVEPIERGLWADSSSYERRRSIKMLKVLDADLKLKVHRADMSAIARDLQPKYEFVITVPLTELQKKAYTLYVDNQSNVEASSQVNQLTMLRWLATLNLLCNHPTCLATSLAEKNLSYSGWDDDSDWGSLNNTVSPPNVDDAMAKLLKAHRMDIDEVHHSHKIQLLERILDASAAVGDKVLVFSQSILTLDYLERIFRRAGRSYARLDGQTVIKKRQQMTKNFNTGSTQVFLISTTAGGLGLNIQGANRVVIMDFRYNPTWEEQAVGRAYRIGQPKPVYVYRFIAGGTFEEEIHNKAVFKLQLATRVVDKKNTRAWAKRSMSDFLFRPKEVEQTNLSSHKGTDLHVLDKILDMDNTPIRKIVPTDTFWRVENETLTAEEQTEVEQLIIDAKLRREDPAAWKVVQDRREWELKFGGSLAKHRAAIALHRSRLLAEPSRPSINSGINYQANNGIGIDLTGASSSVSGPGIDSPSIFSPPIGNPAINSPPINPANNPASNTASNNPAANSPTINSSAVQNYALNKPAAPSPINSPALNTPAMPSPPINATGNGSALNNPNLSNVNVYGPTNDGNKPQNPGTTQSSASMPRPHARSVSGVNENERLGPVNTEPWYREGALMALQQADLIPAKSRHSISEGLGRDNSTGFGRFAAPNHGNARTASHGVYESPYIGQDPNNYIPGQFGRPIPVLKSMRDDFGAADTLQHYSNPQQPHQPNHQFSARKQGAATWILHQTHADGMMYGAVAQQGPSPTGNFQPASTGSANPAFSNGPFPPYKSIYTELPNYDLNGNGEEFQHFEHQPVQPPAPAPEYNPPQRDIPTAVETARETQNVIVISSSPPLSAPMPALEPPVPPVEPPALRDASPVLDREPSAEAAADLESPERDIDDWPGYGANLDVADDDAPIEADDDVDANFSDHRLFVPDNPLGDEEDPSDVAHTLTRPELDDGSSTQSSPERD